MKSSIFRTKCSTTCRALLLLSFCQLAISANILYFFPGGNVSHKTAVWPWVLEMAKRGHNVTFISPHPKTPVAHPNIVDHAVKVLQDEVSKVYQVDRFQDREEGKELVFDYNQMSIDTCQAVINSIGRDPVITSIFQNGSSYDLVVINTIFGECGHFVGHYLKAKTITYDSCTMLGWYYDTYGVSPEAGWVPDLLSKYETFPMSFWDRVRATYYTMYWGIERYRLSPMLQNVVQPLFGNKELPELYQLENDVSLVFINSHPSIDFARTLPPLFIDIGGMASTSSLKALPKNFQEFMDKSGSGGVVLISFGSTVLLNTVSTQHQKMFFHLFNSFPNVRFIMRWSGPLPEFLEKTPENLMVSEWLPQKEILSHPKLKIFITHGGVSSIQGATYYGVPMVVMPLFADQDYNGYRIEAQEVGVIAEIRGMTENTLVSALDKMIRSNKYKTNMLKKQAIFRDRPLKPVENAAFWTEFALRHEDTLETLRPMNHHLNIFQRRLIDVYAFYILSFIGLILAGISVTFKISSWLIRKRILGSPSSIKVSKKHN